MSFCLFSLFLQSFIHIITCTQFASSASIPIICTEPRSITLFTEESWTFGEFLKSTFGGNHVENPIVFTITSCEIAQIAQWRRWCAYNFAGVGFTCAGIGDYRCSAVWLLYFFTNTGKCSGWLSRKQHMVSYTLTYTLEGKYVFTKPTGSLAVYHQRTFTPNLILPRLSINKLMSYRLSRPLFGLWELLGCCNHAPS